jgi:tether containing UBX domain for GLUT4
VDLAEQLSDTFVPTTSIWEILRKFEKKVSTKGQTDFNITERCSPTVSNPGSGRLLYQMPAVRVANRELASFDELRKTLEDLGCHGRELLVLRYLPTEMPFEDALMQIASFSGEGAGEEEQPEEEEKTAEVTAEEVERVGSSEPQTSHPPATGPQTTTEIPQDTQIARASKTTLVKPIKKTIMPLQPETQGDGDLDLVEPKIEIYQPSSSAKPAAASFEVPDSAYDITIADLKRIKESYHTAGMPQRLLSDSELEEKQAMARKEMEKINTVGVADDARSKHH